MLPILLTVAVMSNSARPGRDPREHGIVLQRRRHLATAHKQCIGHVISGPAPMHCGVVIHQIGQLHRQVRLMRSGKRLMKASKIRVADSGFFPELVSPAILPLLPAELLRSAVRLTVGVNDLRIEGGKI